MTRAQPNDPSVALRDRVVAAAEQLGFHRVGIVTLSEPTNYASFVRWLDAGRHGEMHFLQRPEHRDGRVDYRCILDGAVTAIVVAAGYDSKAPSRTADSGRVARYAFGEDYHRLIKKALKQIAAVIDEASEAPVLSRACVDTAPVLERDLAKQAGIGFIGKNTMLISPGLGSYTALGELFTTAAIAETEGPQSVDHCGECRACLDACPTSAFPEPYVLDARRCLSYLTIEHRGVIDEGLRPAMGDHIFGCDICQEACPYNQRAPARHAAFPGLSGDDSPRRAPLLSSMVAMASGDYRRLTRSSSMTRAHRRMLKRNAAIALGNQKPEQARDALRDALNDRDEIVRSAAAWALGQLGDREALADARATEQSPEVVAELDAALSRAGVPVTNAP